DAFDAWFLRACHRNPEERFASAAEQVEALAVALGHPASLTETAHKTPFRLVRRSGGESRRRALVVAASVAIVLVAAAVAARDAITTRRDEALVCGLPSRGTTAACGSCMAEACCKQAQECAAAEDCARLATCVGACASGDAACRVDCYATAGSVTDLQ